MSADDTSMFMYSNNYNELNQMCTSVCWRMAQWFQKKSACIKKNVCVCVCVCVWGGGGGQIYTH